MTEPVFTIYRDNDIGKALAYWVGLPEILLGSKRIYIYLGDKMTTSHLQGLVCCACLRRDGKCVRAGSKMLVEFAGFGKVVVLARRLRKIKT